MGMARWTRFDIGAREAVRLPLDRLARMGIPAISTLLLTWSMGSLWPHYRPYAPSILLDKTFVCWSDATLTLALALALALAMLVAASRSAGTAPPPRLRVAAVAVVLGTVAVVYPRALDRNDAQDDYLGFLRLCYRFCGTATAPCVHAPTSHLDARTPARIGAEAVAWFRLSVFGDALPLHATRVAANTIELVYSDAGLDACHRVALTVPTLPIGVLIVVGSRISPYAARLANRLGLAAVAIGPAPPRACGAARARLATRAEAANAVASAIRHGGLVNNRTVSIYGCGKYGKAALYAAAVAPADWPGFAYAQVFLDSGGALVSSVRQVGVCGEPFVALVARWPEWLGPNASEVRDVAARWPERVDASGLVVAGCVFGSRYVVSTSRADNWNNPSGLRVTVAAARRRGCVIELVEADGHGHCELL